jgi:hypothetical protein
MDHVRVHLLQTFLSIYCKNANLISSEVFCSSPRLNFPNAKPTRL